MINNWFKLYLRYFWKNKFFSILNVLGLSMGISALILVLMYWQNEHSYNQWNPYKDRVYEVYSAGFEGGEISPWLPAPMATQIDELSDVVESYTFLWNFTSRKSIEVGDKQDFIFNIADHQASYLDMFPFPAVYGSIKSYKENKDNAIALEHQQAARLFGEGVDPSGKEIVLDGGMRVVVRLVYKIPSSTSNAPDALVSYGAEKMIKDNINVFGDYNYNILIKLKEGVQLNIVKDRIINTLYQPFLTSYAKSEGITEDEYRAKYMKEDQYVFFDLESAHLNPKSQIYGSGGNAKKILTSMLVVSLLLLLLSIFNAVNLNMVQSFKRAREVGIRKALGGSKSNIISQFVFESLLTVLMSFIIALFLVELLLPYFNLLVDRTLVFYISDFIVELFVVVVVILLLSAILPALFAASFNPLKVLKGNFVRSKSGVVIRNIFLVLQFVIAFFFLTIALFMNKQITYLINQNLGFKGEQIVNIEYELSGFQNRDEVFRDFKDDFLKIKGVEGVSAHSFNIGQQVGSASTNFIGDVSLQSGNIVIDHSFLDVMGVQLKEGRFFDPELQTDNSEKVLVNEAFEKAFNLKEGVIGKEIRWNNRVFQIIGVVKNFNVHGFNKEVSPQTYFLGDSVGWFHHLLETISVKLKTDDVQGTLINIEKFWKDRVEPVYPMEYGFADEQFANTYRQATYQKTLFFALMSISVFTALVGLLSIVSFSIENRLKEVAIRKVMGADSRSLIVALSRSFVLYCVLGFCISIYPVYFAVHLWLEDFAYREVITVMSFIVAFSSLFILSILLVIWKAYKATRIDVLKYIKYE
ncbi:ABC transporter permease [Myroides odoratimimus]|uniref:ABC transporter permease n=1 Tax=Myroides odoratimimus TaxID=76832 RepID=UPI002575E358|nr:ABC transporter permease [Myroides odoratimimus]MDM1091952.1 ABC transporter permease [Myroides odoratimimus]MDM1444299.1 ABC transporter permease [Myroides odoratimimus]MDM1448725.1 ABC transporter permease [Myroides odoratimimus]MDM1465711.1 ABC transporter permease [Myroides odoratimimus]MDM1469170.1 ABC transporter permease [Myroides odoratimimus]